MVSIVVSWCDRDEIGLAMPSILAAADSVQGDVTVVNYTGSSSRLRELLGTGANRIGVVEVLEERFFNKSAAQNVGAHCTVNPYLFFCDCDIILELGTIRTIINRLSNDNTFATLAGVRESNINSRGARHVTSFGYELNIRTADGRHLRIVDSEEDGQTGTRQAPGLLVVRRTDFIAINGYNSKLHGWGWEDQDMIARLTLGRGLTRIMDGFAIHMSHDETSRLAHYPPISSRWESRDKMFRAALSNYDEANFSGTMNVDVDRLKYRQVKFKRSGGTSEDRGLLD